MNLLLKHLTAGLLLGSLIPAQSRLFDHPGLKPGDGFGRSLAFAGDVDADGVEDLLIGARNYVQIRSGSHGGLLHHVSASAPAQEFGMAVLGPGDLDGDGHDDFLVSSPRGGSLGQGVVTAYSGKTGRQLYKVAGDRQGDGFGTSLCRVGDLDADGRPDFGVGAPGHDNIGVDAGMIRIYSGSKGKPIYYYTGVKAGGGFGSSLTAIGDLDADGVDDILVGAAAGDYARIYSALRASLIRMTQGSPGSSMGQAVLRSADMNADKIDDYWIAAPDERASGKGLGVLRLYSGMDGKVLQTLHGPEGLAQLSLLKPGPGARSFGWSLCAAGDVDADGHSDLLVADPFASAPTLTSGRVQLFSGKTGLVLASWNGTAAGDLLGSNVIGQVDFDGDQVPDVALASYGTGKVLLYSGKTQLLLRTLTGSAQDGFGAKLMAHPDMDADQRPDILVTSPFHDGFRGKVELFSYATGKVLKTWKGPNKGDAFGTDISLAPDQDGDGIPELIVTSPAFASSAGRLVVLSSKTGLAIVDLQGAAPGDRLGERAVSAGDLDGDDPADILVSAPGASGGKGEIYARSGRDGSLLYKIHGQVAGGRLGSSLALLEDMDGDGLPEILAGAPTDTSATPIGMGSFSIYSGAQGRLLLHEPGTTAGQAMGAALAAIGDIDDDGREDFAVASLGGMGSVRLYHAEHPITGFGRSMLALPDQDSDGFDDILVGLPGQGRLQIHSTKQGTLLTTLAPQGRSYGYGTSLGIADLNFDKIPDLAIGGPAQGVEVLSLRTPAMLGDPQSWPVQKGGLQTWDLHAGKAHAGKVYMVLGSVSGTSPGVRLGAFTVPLNPDAYTNLMLSYPNQVPFLASRGYLDLQGRAKAGLVLPGLHASLKGLVFHHAFLVLGFSFQFEYASNPVPLRLR